MPSDIANLHRRPFATTGVLHLAPTAPEATGAAFLNLLEAARRAPLGAFRQHIIAHSRSRLCSCSTHPRAGRSAPDSGARLLPAGSALCPCRCRKVTLEQF